jgi:aerobic-type carbon monoxide dehydrogenase small subunit (CoxS/CutS family)
VTARSIAMTVNGRAVTVTVRAPGQTLLEVLRGELHLTGAKAGCEMGECGACTVLLDGQPVTSCLVPALAAEGATIETIEGLTPGQGSALHPVQAAFVEEGAVQCGFCTPGVVLSAVALLRETPTPSEPQIREALAGNLCRCTGYARIIRAVNRAAEEEEP